MFGSFLSIGGFVGGLISITTGIIILVWPRILAYIIGIYLIIIGLITVIAVLRG